MNIKQNIVKKEFVREGDTKFEILVEGEYYRVTNVEHLVGVNEDDKFIVMCLPLSYGLAIEEKLENEGAQVVCIIKWDDKKHGVVYEDVAFRSVETLDGAPAGKIDEYINNVLFAKQALLDMHENN